jgi:endo-1,4-beta-xylanase
MKTAALLLAPLLATATPLVSRQDVESIDTLFKSPPFKKVYFGAATDKEKLEDGNDNIIRNYFGQITPEYSAQWNVTQPHATPDARDRAKSNAVFQWAVDNQKSIRGHSLLWYKSIPDYVERITDPAEMRKAIETHIGEMMNQWKGQIRAWDVVNEVFEDNGSFRNSAFYRVL